MSDSHGSTPAAWTAVVIGLIGFTVGGVGVMFTPMNRVVFYVGLAITAVAVVIYLVGHKVLTQSGDSTSGHGHSAQAPGRAPS